MSSISALSNWQPAVRYQPQPASRSNAPAGSSPSSPSTVVKLSPEALAAASEPLTAAARYKDLGAAMLNQFTTGGPVPVKHDELPAGLDNQFSLSIVTRSGTKVDLTLANVDDGMIFQVSASADLSDDERKALARLAGGFQSAIDGLAQGEPQVRLAALTRIDSKFLESVDFHAEVRQGSAPSERQVLDFHIDGKQRKVSLNGPSGQAEVSVDTATLESLGSKEQQARAINNYLKQFDQAALRGHGDARLMSMFKDAFSDMNRTSSRAEAADTGLSTEKKWTLSSEEHAVLSGLSDFSASITQTPKFSNPLKLAETDTFAYEVSQNTSVSGERRDDRAIAQAQKASLKAQYHLSLKGDAEPKLDIDPNSQNYQYRQIDDSASSNVELGYKDGRLVRATLEQSVNQSERIRKYVLGRMTADNTVPAQQTLVRDLMSTLAPYRAGENGNAREESSAARDERRQLSLDSLNGNMLLLSNPFELKARDQAW